MGKLWSGFMAQNEIVKQQWAAMEDQIQKAERAYRLHRLRRALDSPSAGQLGTGRDVDSEEGESGAE
ncbi:MAG TPA: hypothetical protein VEC99_11375 [Clostridia bacterium]|nr:hypothetical protein [Clostridia bacterium]